MTNADKIRLMTDEELTEFLPNLCTNINPRENECLRYGSCYKCVSIWLKREVKGNAQNSVPRKTRG